MGAVVVSEDFRIPVWLGAPPCGAKGIACVLPAGADPVDCPYEMASPHRHVGFCVCCCGRAPVAEALSRLYLRAARGELPPLTAIYAPGWDKVGRGEVARVLVADGFCAARFRLGGAA